MRFEKAPITSTPSTLDLVDFAVFSSAFAEILKEKVPTSARVSFVTREEFVRTSANSEDYPSVTACVFKKKNPQKVGTASFLLPLPVKNEEPFAAFVEGIDALVFERTSIEWLQDVIEESVEDFLSFKKSYIDPVTGLYSKTLLDDILQDAQLGQRNIHLALVELFPPARTPKDVFNHVKRGARSLADYDSYGFPLFHIGQSIFALVVPQRDRSFLKKYCLSLITYMKNRGFKKVHCGCSSVTLKRDGRKISDEQYSVLDEAWTALHVACKRGPYAFCDYDLLENPDHFPLQDLPKKMIARLQRQWRNCSRFSLAFFKPDFQENCHFSDMVVRYFGGCNYLIAHEGLFVIRKEENSSQTKEWAEEIVNKITSENGSGFSLSVGVSEYPFMAPSKTEVIRNCMKALLHGEFYGYGSCVVFDALSLNVSGDIYFGEGDLVGAVKEYRRGLTIDEGNTNLLNSLGVTYALMNRNKEAQDCFGKALEINPENFMALYNKGLGELRAGDYVAAADDFQKALEVLGDDKRSNDNVKDDLIYQYGRVCFFKGQYDRSIDMLATWYADNAHNAGKGKCCRYLGLGYYRLFREKEAIVWLQRAVVFDEYDAEALNILAELYYKEGQGEEIAFKLFEKSIELKDNDPSLCLRFGACLNLSGESERALAMLSGCVRNPAVRHEAWYELAVAHRNLNQYSKARYYLKKLKTGKSVSSILLKKAQKIKI